MAQRNSYRVPFIFLTVLFFLWGFITVLVDSLIPRLREVFTLTYFQAGLVQFAFFGAYFLLSIPSGYLLSRIGYKKGLLLGLCTMAAGCLLFYPAASERLFSLFILGYFILAAGITILQVAANPYVTVLGPEETASSRLNLSQAFNSLGTAIAPAIGALFILGDKVKSKEEIKFLSEAEQQVYFTAEASAVQIPFLGIAAFIAIIALVFAFVKLPKFQDSKASNNFSQVFKSRKLLLGAVGIFFYVGAEVAIGSYIINYFLSLDLADTIRTTEFMRFLAELILTSGVTNSTDMAVVGVFVTFYWSGAMVGRFIGSYLTKVVSPAVVLSVFASCAIGLILISSISTGLMAMWTLLAVGLFNSIMFPTIFSLALDGLGELKPEASGILCTMIVGGAIIPPAFGFLIDSFSFNAALNLVMCCYAYILFYGFYSKRDLSRRLVPTTVEQR